MPVDFYGNVRATKLRPVSGIAFGRYGGGIITTSRHTEPYWAATMRTPNLSQEDRKGWLAWLDDCVDLNRRVDFIHPLYRYPAGYDAATWPVSSDPELVSITDLRTIVVSGLDIGVVLPAGTRLTLMQGDYRCYRKIVETVTVSSAISQSLSIGPRLYPGVFAASAIVRFENPMVRMMVVPESWDADEDVDLLPLEFEMMESLV